MTTDTPSSFETAQDLATFVSQGWDLHGKEPKRVADALLARVTALSPDEHGAGAIRLAEHVYLSHLSDQPALERFLAALPPTLESNEMCVASRKRTHWVLANLAGQPGPEIPDRFRWSGMQNLWSMWVKAGRAEEATSMLATELERARQEPDVNSRRSLAATCNNVASELREGARGSAAVDNLMIRLAEASAELWTSGGTWVNAERADYLLARCHATLGNGAVALKHANSCLSTIEAHAGESDCNPFELFFAHEAVAWAHHASGNREGLNSERETMRTLRGQITDASLLPWCEGPMAALEQAKV